MMRKTIAASLIIIFGLFYPVGYVVPEISISDSPLAISMDFKDASLKDILKVFAIQSGLNFIASQAVQDRKVTLYLDKVPLKEAMDELFKANNLSYELDEAAKIIVVKDWGTPAVEKITKIFTLKHASVSTSSLRQDLYDYLAAGKGTLTKEGLSEGGGGGGAGGTGKWKTEPSAGITAVIWKLLTKDGSIIEEPRTNSLIITDIPSRFPAIEETIKRLDIPVPQVMLEVEMLDVSKNSVDKLGIKFPNSLVQLDMTKVARATGFPFGGKGFDPQGQTLESSTAGAWKVDKWPAAHFGPAIFSIINSQLTLDFLKSQTDTKYLARPKILTLNNEPAEIEIITDEVLGEEKSVSGTGTTGTTTTKAERGDTGVSLRITPQINSDTGEITMFIVPFVAEASPSGVVSSTGVLYYNRERRTTKSVVRVKDGETVIVGGLIRNETNEVTTKLPILGDIPLLGMLFRHKDRTKGRERELLVFITPRIIKEQPAQFAKIEKTEIPSGREQPTNSDVTRQKFINGVLGDFEKKYK